MPILTKEETYALTPFFSKGVGKRVADLLYAIASVPKVNALYDRCDKVTGPAFCRKLLECEGVSYMVHGYERLLSMKKPFITISNHAYGGMDGIILIDLMGRLIPDFKVMVNQFLAIVKALGPSLIVVDPNFGTENRPTATSIRGVRACLEHIMAGHPLGIFPSGAVSDLSLSTPAPHHSDPALDSDFLGPADGTWAQKHIRDRKWQIPAIRLIQKAKIPVLPVRFFDLNTFFYYSLGLLSSDIRLLRLPKECLNKKGKKIRLGIGEPIMPEELSRFNTPEELRKFLRASVYGMKLPTSPVVSF